MALKIFPYFMILCFSRNTAMSPSTGSITTIHTTPVPASTDVSACPRSASIPVVGMCQDDTQQGHSLYLDTSFYSDRFTECSCNVAVTAGNGSVDIYSENIDRKNCIRRINIADIRYSLDCRSKKSHVTTHMNSSQVLRVDMTGHGVARYCLHMETDNEHVNIQLNCSSGVAAGTSLTTSATSSETTPSSVPSSPPTSLAASSPPSTPSSPSPSTSPSTSASVSPTLTPFVMYSASTAISSSSTMAHTLTSAPETDSVETSSPGSGVSAIASAGTTPPDADTVETSKPGASVSATASAGTTPDTDSVETSSPGSGVSATSSPKTTMKASQSTLRPLTNSPEPGASLLVTTKKISKKPPSTQSTYTSLSPSSPPSASPTVSSFTTLEPETSKSTPISENITLADANSQGYRFPVLGLAVGLLAGILLLLVIMATVLFYRFRHEKTYNVDEEEIAASVISPQDCTTHIQVLNPIYCDDPEMKSLSNYELRPHDNVSTVSSFVSEEPSNSDASLKDADPELNQEQKEMMETLASKPGRDCSKRMSYCSPGGRKGSTQGLYQL